MTSPAHAQIATGVFDHPDVNQGDKAASETRIKEINEAYEVLGDTEKRKKYDQLGANWRQYEQAGAQGGAGFDPPIRERRAAYARRLESDRGRHRHGISVRRGGAHPRLRRAGPDRKSVV